jgi:hypothetical protein
LRLVQIDVAAILSVDERGIKRATDVMVAGYGDVGKGGGHAGRCARWLLDLRAVQGIRSGAG